MNWQSVLIPGMFTLLGALISVGTTTFYQEVRDRREKGSRAEADQRRTQGAALLVSDELRANIVRLEISQQTNQAPEELESQSYQDLQVDLAFGLPTNVMSAVRRAYVYARVPRSLQRHRSEGGRTIVEPNPLVPDALDRANRARTLLQPLLPPGIEEI